MTVDGHVEAPTALTITRDYLSLDAALGHAASRLSASPQTARDAADRLVRQLFTAQGGVLTSHQVSAIASAAHMAATADGAVFDESTQQYQACCDQCAKEIGNSEERRPGWRDRYEERYGYSERDGKLYNKAGNEVCRTCYVPRYMHAGVSTPNHHPYNAGTED